MTLSVQFFPIEVYWRRPWWPIQSLNSGRKKKIKGYEEKGIGSSLLILDLKGGKLYDSGRKEEGKTFHKLHVLGMNDDSWDKVYGLCVERARVIRASGVLVRHREVSPQNNNPLLLRTMSVKTSVQDGKISN